MYSFINLQEVEPVTSTYKNGATLVEASDGGTLFSIEASIIEGGNV